MNFVKNLQIFTKQNYNSLNCYKGKNTQVIQEIIKPQRLYQVII